MKKIALSLVIFSFVVSIAPAQAATAAATAVTPQQNRMKNCAAQYHQKNIAKSQYHQFMSQCLKTPPMTPAKGAAAAK